MRINQLLLRQQQRSILRDERMELLTIFEVEVSGTHGKVIGEQSIDKRDVEGYWYADSQELADKLGEDELYKLDVVMWSIPPMLVTQTPQTNEIRRNTQILVK